MRVARVVWWLAAFFVSEVAAQAQPGFTYQGQVRNTGALVNGTCDFEVSLWDDPDAGVQAGTLQSVPLVPVNGGRFTLLLNQNGEFGPQGLNGMPRWLQLSLRCGAEAVFTTVLPRQPLTPAPYAHALPGIVPGDFPASSNQGGTAGAFSIAMGRRARAVNTGALVFADSTNANFTSSADNQVAIRAANGVVIANDAGGSKSVPVGTRYRDNAVVAWARVTASGTLENDFNVDSVTRLSAGVYRIALASSLSSGFSLIPAVTPEIDPASPDAPPATGAAAVRIPAVNLVASGATLYVYMYNGSFALVDNDFQLLIAGR